ncbi:unnamed protein product [Ixodes pacificus]
MYFRYVSDPFLRTVCQVRVASRLPGLIVSTSSMSGGIHRYLKEVVASCKFLLSRFSVAYLSEVPRKRYKAVCDTVFPVPLYRALYCAGPGQDVLKRVKRMVVPTGTKTFFFKLHSGTLPVKTWLNERGLFVPWGIIAFYARSQRRSNTCFLSAGMGSSSGTSSNVP